MCPPLGAYDLRFHLAAMAHGEVLLAVRRYAHLHLIWPPLVFPHQRRGRHLNKVLAKLPEAPGVCQEAVR